ncbi:MAG: hypothetical protein KGL39_13130 [Patescibacteria group bacterium]|nr:hypothetical protein [Patescibacteria group bacterium]
MAESKEQSLESLIARANAVDVRKYLVGDSLKRIQQQIANEPDPAFRDVQQRLLDSVLERKEKEEWNCDDTSLVEHLFQVHSTDLYACIGAFCSLHVPDARVTSERGNNLRLRFHPHGALGMSITSWREIHLVKYSKPAPDKDSDLYSGDLALGYDDIHRFRDFRQVCDEINRVSALAAARRARYASILANIAGEITARLPTARVWVLQDDAVHVELEPHVVMAKVSPYIPDRYAPRRRAGKRRNGRSRSSGTRRRRGGSWWLGDRVNVARWDEYVIDGRREYAYSKTIPQALQLLEKWFHACMARRRLFDNCFARVIGRHPGATRAFAQHTMTIVRAPGGYRQPQDIRLLSIHNGTPRLALTLWAAVMATAKGEHAIVVSRKVYEDDSGATPNANTQVLTVDISPERSHLSTSAELYDKLVRVYEHYLRARQLLYREIVLAQVDAKRWVECKYGAPRPPGTYRVALTIDDKVNVSSDANSVAIAYEYTASDWGLALAPRTWDPPTVRGLKTARAVLDAVDAMMVPPPQEKRRNRRWRYPKRKRRGGRPKPPS